MCVRRARLTNEPRMPSPDLGPLNFGSSHPLAILLHGSNHPIDLVCSLPLGKVARCGYLRLSGSPYSPDVLTCSLTQLCEGVAKHVKLRLPNYAKTKGSADIWGFARFHGTSAV